MALTCAKESATPQNKPDAILDGSICHAMRHHMTNVCTGQLSNPSTIIKTPYNVDRRWSQCHAWRYTGPELCVSLWMKWCILMNGWWVKKNDSNNFGCLSLSETEHVSKHKTKNVIYVRCSGRGHLFAQQSIARAKYVLKLINFVVLLFCHFHQKQRRYDTMKISVHTFYVNTTLTLSRGIFFLYMNENVC